MYGTTDIMYIGVFWSLLYNSALLISFTVAVAAALIHFINISNFGCTAALFQLTDALKHQLCVDKSGIYAVIIQMCDGLYTWKLRVKCATPLAILHYEITTCNG